MENSNSKRKPSGAIVLRPAKLSKGTGPDLTDPPPNKSGGRLRPVEIQLTREAVVLRFVHLQQPIRYITKATGARREYVEQVIRQVLAERALLLKVAA